MDLTAQLSCLVQQLKLAVPSDQLAEQDQLNIKLIPDCSRDKKTLELDALYLLGLTLNYALGANEGPILPDCYYETFSEEPITNFAEEIIECLP